MTIHSWISKFLGTTPGSRARKARRGNAKRGILSPSRARLRLEMLESRITPSTNLQSGGVVHLPFTTAEVEGTTGNNSAQVFTGNTQVNATLLDFTDTTGSLTDYSVTVTWGDGSADTIVGNAAGGPFTVTGAAGPGPFNFHIVATSTAANAHVYEEAANGNV